MYTTFSSYSGLNHKTLSFLHRTWASCLAQWNVLLSFVVFYWYFAMLLFLTEMAKTCFDDFPNDRFLGMKFKFSFLRMNSRSIIFNQTIATVYIFQIIHSFFYCCNLENFNQNFKVKGKLCLHFSYELLEWGILIIDSKQSSSLCDE